MISSFFAKILQVVVNKLWVSTPSDKALQAFTLEHAEMDVQFPGVWTQHRLGATDRPVVRKYIDSITDVII